MKNLRRIVDSLLLCDFVGEIILSNNNPEVRMEDFVGAGPASPDHQSTALVFPVAL